MDLGNKNVIHSTFGLGVIKKQDDKYITVEFNDQTKVFIFPDAFRSFLKAEDPQVQKEIEQLLKTSSRSAPSAPLELSNPSSPLMSTIPSEKVFPMAGVKRNIYFVFQNKTFEVEYRGGYIWAPIGSSHHWERLKMVRKGDVMIHSCGGVVQAFSVAKGRFIPCIQPEAMIGQGWWPKDGRKVECLYTYVQNPIKLSKYKKEIIKYGGGQYQPFNVNGTGNQGYLFEINRPLAKLFIRESVMQNPTLKQLDYISEVLEED